MSKRFIIFFSIFFSLYGIINFYIFIHAYNSLPDNLRLVFSIVYWILALSFIAGRFLERKKITAFSNLLVWVGSFWLAAMLYFFLAVLIVDLVLLVDLPLHFWNENISMLLFHVVTAVVAITLFAGYLNAKNTRIKDLHLSIEGKDNAKPRRYRIVSVSDIHLGTIIGSKRLKKIVEKINLLQPDVVLLPGDVVDEDITPVINQNLGEVLKSINAKFGVYSVTGNHEYIGGVEKAVSYLMEHDVRVLRDECALIDNNLHIVGREDISKQNRKSLEELTANIDKNMPIILMDHQPYKLQQAVDNRIDLQLSGHTHHGQMWPLSFITKKMYEVSWGYKKKGNTHIYVSCGAGTWGPPVRIGNTPEIMNITIEVK